MTQTTLFTVRVRPHEVGLRFKDSELVEVLAPGKHWRLPGSLYEVYSRLRLRFEHRELELLLTNEALREHLDVVDLAGHERALVFRSGRLESILAPGLYAFWKQEDPLTIERFDVRDPRFEHASMEQILAHESAIRHIKAIRVESHEDILAYHGGRLMGRLGPGVHAFWHGGGPVTWKSFDRREQLLDVAGQEIMTRDKVTLRVNLVVSYRITEPETVAAASSDVTQDLYRASQLALRAAIGTRTLDQLLSDKDAARDEIQKPVAERARGLGLELADVGLRDVILPGEMKLILNQVIEAQKQSEANLIRRREETAAARSQANTARLLAENPVLLRMKELEQVAQILAGSNAKLVLGPGDLTEQLRGIVGEGARDS